MKNTPSAEVMVKVAEMYESGMHFKDIAPLLGFAPSTLVKAYKAMGRTLRPRGGARNVKVSDALLPEIIRRYEAGELHREIAKSLGVSTSAITLRLLSVGHTSRHKGAQRTLTVKDDAFDALTPEAAYWLGFLTADGHLTERDQGRSPVIQFTLSAVDRGHLEKMSTFLGFNGSIKIGVRKSGYAASEYAFLRLTSRLLYDAAKRWGVMDAKAGGMIGPELAASRDFWRGVVDGDGWITREVPGGCTIGLCGSHEILCGFQDFLAGKGLHKNAIYPLSSIFNTMWAGRYGKAVADILYAGATVFLDRKMARYQTTLSY